jgi:hypothetical protein
VKFWQVAKIVVVLWPSLATFTSAIGINEVLSASSRGGWHVPESASLAILGIAMLMATRHMRRQVP